MIVARSIVRWSICIALWLTVARALVAGDWPQILGPDRNGQAHGEQLAERWPADGPRVLWSRPVGLGYAGPAVVDGQLVVFHRFGQHERVEKLDAATGRTLWKVDFPATYRGGVNSDTGPRCVPVVLPDRDRLVVYGAAGDLHCLQWSSGRVLWSRQARLEYDAEDGYFGAGSTPLVVGDRVLVNIGAHRRGAGIVAFSLADGKTLWAATDERASYASPIRIDLDGKPWALFVTRLNAMCVDPQTGDVRFQIPFGRLGPTVNAATPLWCDGHLFLSASYGIGARWVKIDSGKPRIVWSRDDVLSSQYATAVYRHGFLYGTHGREDIGIASLRCVEAASGTVRWNVDDFGVAHVILVGDRLLIWRVDGELVLAKASPTRYEELARARIFDDIARALPALSNGRLFVRSTSERGGQLKCVDLRPH